MALPDDARPLSRAAVTWALVSDAVPLYPLYALLFTEHGLDEPTVAGLFALWSAVGLVAEVPSGAFADRFSRRSALVLAGLLQAAAYALWTELPGLPAFAAGFVLWGVGGALISGALEALLYDGLAAAGAESAFPRVLGRVNAAYYVSELPTAALASGLFLLGGFRLVGWVSIVICVVGSFVATRLPEPPRRQGPPDEDDAPDGYVETLRAGVTEAVRRPPVLRCVLAVTMLGGLDGLEEFFPLVAQDEGVSVVTVPLVLVGVAAAGVAGSLSSGLTARLTGRGLGTATVVAGLMLAAAAAPVTPVAALVGVAASYGLHQAVLVAAESRLQEQITGPARATVTSVAGLGTEVTALVLFAAWALGGLPLAAAMLVGAGLAVRVLMSSASSTG